MGSDGMDGPLNRGMLRAPAVLITITAYGLGTLCEGPDRRDICRKQRLCKIFTTLVKFYLVNVLLM